MQTGEAMMQTQDLAQLIHDEWCGDQRPCRRWMRQESHRQFYRDRAESIMGQLGPLIGAANVPAAVRVVLSELS